MKDRDIFGHKAEFKKSTNRQYKFYIKKKNLLIVVSVIPASHLQLSSQGDHQTLPTITMTNASTAGGTILQYSQDGQFFVPSEIGNFFIPLPFHKTLSSSLHQVARV